MAEWKTLEKFRQELLEDPEFKARFETLDHEYVIAREILAARKSAGMTQEDLAKAIGTSQSRISKWERGEETPRVEALFRIAKATGTEVQVALVKAAV